MFEKQSIKSGVFVLDEQDTIRKTVRTNAVRWVQCSGSVVSSLDGPSYHQEKWLVSGYHSALYLCEKILKIDSDIELIIVEEKQIGLEGSDTTFWVKVKHYFDKGSTEHHGYYSQEFRRLVESIGVMELYSLAPPVFLISGAK